MESNKRETKPEEANGTAAEAKPQRQGLVPNVISGLATGLFSIPGRHGLRPAGTILMMSTLTSAIALATGSVIQVAGIQDNQVPQALFTITFLVGVIMFVPGILRLGSIVNFVSNAVMSGFVTGASLLIILGQEHHMTGYSPTGANEMQKTMVVNLYNIFEK